MHNCTYSIQAWDDSLGQWASSVEDQVDFKNWLQPFNKLTSTLQQSSASQMRACCWRTPAIQSATNHDSNILGIHAPPWGRGGGLPAPPRKTPLLPRPSPPCKNGQICGAFAGQNKGDTLESLQFRKAMMKKSDKTQQWLAQPHRFLALPTPPQPLKKKKTSKSISATDAKLFIPTETSPWQTANLVMSTMIDPTILWSSPSEELRRWALAQPTAN